MLVGTTCALRHCPPGPLSGAVPPGPRPSAARRTFVPMAKPLACEQGAGWSNARPSSVSETSQYPRGTPPGFACSLAAQPPVTPQLPGRRRASLGVPMLGGKVFPRSSRLRPGWAQCPGHSEQRSRPIAPVRPDPKGPRAIRNVTSCARSVAPLLDV